MEDTSEQNKIVFSISHHVYCSSWHITDVEGLMTSRSNFSIGVLVSIIIIVSVCFHTWLNFRSPVLKVLWLKLTSSGIS